MYVISIQMKEQRYICDANPVGVCLSAACMCGRYNVSLCILHTCSIRTRALWILISHFVISRYPAGEVCALECEASVCLDVTRGSAGDLHFSIRGENRGTWLCRIRLTKLGLSCSLEDWCGKRKQQRFAFFCWFSSIMFQVPLSEGSLTFTENRNQSDIREIINHTDVKM